jgi:hypothetical protein
MWMVEIFLENVFPFLREKDFFIFWNNFGRKVHLRNFYLKPLKD